MSTQAPDVIVFELEPTFVYEVPGDLLSRLLMAVDKLDRLAGLVALVEESDLEGQDGTFDWLHTLQGMVSQRLVSPEEMVMLHADIHGRQQFWRSVHRRRTEEKRA